MNVIITSTSRPEALKLTVNSFLDNVRFSAGFTFSLHEDVVDAARSEELIRWARTSGVFEYILVTKPADGRGPALNKLKRFVMSNYIIYLEDDWEFLQPLDLEDLITVMDEHPRINQVAFSNRANPELLDKPGPGGLRYYHFKPITFGHQTLLVAERWNWFPSVWRVSFVRPYWQFADRGANKNFNRIFKSRCKGLDEWDHKWQQDNIGAYLYGNIGDGPFTRHIADVIANDRSMM